MLRTTPLKGNRDFRRIYGHARSYVSKSLVLYAMKNKSGKTRLGITVSKKLGCAVRRNRAKRLIREAYRMSEPDMKAGYDFVIVARGRILGMKTPDVYRDFSQVLRGANLFLK